MKTFTAVLVAVMLIAPANAGETAVDADLKKLQGKWLLQSQRDGATVRVVKQVEGNIETVSVYRDEQLIHEHVADFDIKKTEDVTIFTYRNQKIIAGPSKGIVKEGPFSYLYRIRGDRWFAVFGILNSDDEPFRVDWFERVKDVPLSNQ